jgi:hypothetical protein
VSASIFKSVAWEVGQLVDAVGTGVVQLPDLQRPFVWPKTKVRDLLDSMYRGYPVGELMFWNVAAGDDSRAINPDANREASHQIVDGQQRLTSLYAALKGRAVRDHDYNDKSIVISFKPFDERFEVPNASTKSAEWIPDIAALFESPGATRREFRKRYEAAFGPMSEELEDRLEVILDRVTDIQKYRFQVVEIQGTASKATVADIFVRINSEGVNLKAADFILTWLSVFWPDGREQFEDFARNSRMTADRATEITKQRVTWTPKNHFISPDAGQLVRVLVAVGQNRAKLSDAYNALQAKDRATGFVQPAKQEEELDKLKAALPTVLESLHWTEFLRCLPSAGFRSRKMVTSETTLLYGYVIWLLGRTRFKVELATLRALIARFFFMAQLTSRYSSSAESQLQKDLDRFKDIGAGNADAFASVLDGIIATELGDDFWNLRMPDALVTSNGAQSPAYQAYLAALNILDADMFMLANDKVRDWMDPTVPAKKGTEGHHLFPVAHQKNVLGTTDIKRINQAANFAPTDWNTNIRILDRAPSEYWPALVAERSLPAERLAAQRFWHAIPEGWELLGYDEFLRQRRLNMSLVTKAAFERLGASGAGMEIRDAEVIADDLRVSRALDVGELIDGGVLAIGDTLVGSHLEQMVEAEVTEDRQLRVGDDVYDTLDDAARSVGASNLAGAEFWQKNVDGETVSLNVRMLDDEAVA